MKEKAIATVERFIKALNNKNYKKARKQITITNQKQMTLGAFRERVKDAKLQDQIEIISAAQINNVIVDVKTSAGIVRCVSESGYHKAAENGHLGLNFQSATKLFKKKEND
jgi:hypothetical protein